MHSDFLITLYLLYYAKTCYELAVPISASLRPGNTVSFKEMSQPRRAFGNTASDLTGPNLNSLINVNFSIRVGQNRKLVCKSAIAD